MSARLARGLCALARTLERGATVASYVAGGTLSFEELCRHMDRDWRHFGLEQSEQDIGNAIEAAGYRVRKN